MIHRSRAIDQNMHLPSGRSISSSPKRFRNSIKTKEKPFYHRLSADNSSSFHRFLTFHQNYSVGRQHTSRLIFYCIKHFIKTVVQFLIGPLLLFRRIILLSPLRFRTLLFFLFSLTTFLFFVCTSIVCMFYSYLLILLYIRLLFSYIENFILLIRRHLLHFNYRSLLIFFHKIFKFFNDRFGDPKLQESKLPSVSFI